MGIVNKSKSESVKFLYKVRPMVSNDVGAYFVFVAFVTLFLFIYPAIIVLLKFLVLGTLAILLFFTIMMTMDMIGIYVLGNDGNCDPADALAEIICHFYTALDDKYDSPI